MKKTFVILAAAVAALFAVSCVKETPNDNLAPVGMKTVTLTADYSNLATKTTYGDQGQFSWTEGDQISVWCSDEQFHTLTATSAGKRVEFTGELPEEVSLGWYAFYPADENHAADCHFNIPMYKDLSVTGSADLPMAAQVEDGVYVFKHMTAAALVTFTKFPADATSADVTFVNARMKFSGSFEAVISSEEGAFVWNSVASDAEGTENGNFLPVEERTFSRTVPVVNGTAKVYLPYNGSLWWDYDSTVDVVAHLSNGKEVELVKGRLMNADEASPERGTIIPYAPLELPNYLDFSAFDWNAENVAVAVNDESATSDFKMKEIRSFGDDNYLYVRLATAQGLPLEADHLGLSFCDGEGSKEVWWGWTTTGTNTYYGQHMGEIDADGKLTGMSFGDAEVFCHTEVSGESVTWYLAFPRESVEQYVSAKGKIYVSALLWNAWSGYWAVPARGGAMLAVTLFEDPNSLKNADWNADNVVAYDLPEGASAERQSLRSVKYFADAENIKVRLVASAEKLAEEKEDDGVMTPTTHLGIFLYDVVNGSGDGYWGWWNSAAGNNEYEGEHVGVITGTDLSLSVNGVNVEVEKVVEGDDVVWMFAIPRSSHANLAANEVNMAFIAYRNWGQTGALPDKYDDMFKVTLP